MKLVKDGEITKDNNGNTRNKNNRFIEIGLNGDKKQTYELKSIHIDLITEKVVILINDGYFDEENNWNITRQWRGIVENQSDTVINRVEELYVKDNIVTPSKKIHDSKDIMVFNERKIRIKHYKVLENNDIKFKNIKSEFVTVRYKTKLDSKVDYNDVIGGTFSRNLENAILKILRKETVTWS